MRRASLGLLVIVVSLISTKIVRADEPTPAPAPSDTPAGTPAAPKSAIDIALEDQQARNFARACLALKKAYREDPRPRTLFLLAQCHDQWGQIATAAVLYEDYEAAFDKLSDDEQKGEADREEIASKRRTEIEKRIPKVVLKLPREAPGSSRVMRRSSEGGPLVPVALGIPLPIDPGEHVLITQVPGRADAFTKFVLKEGENRVVELNVPVQSADGDPTQKPKPIQPVPTLTPPLDPGISGRRVAAYTLGAIGAVSLVGGIVTGAITFAQKDPIANNCLATNQKICNPTGVGAKETAKISGLVSTVLFPVGGVGLVVGTILYFTEPPPSKFGRDDTRWHWNVAATPGFAGVEVTRNW
ncbi:MAG TPA: hypothetical protein PKA58_19210 [Polyangium sp.]|nr:hypothetical protein [Polyangium sp.]